MACSLWATLQLERRNNWRRSSPSNHLLYQPLCSLTTTYHCPNISRRSYSMHCPTIGRTKLPPHHLHRLSYTSQAAHTSSWTPTLIQEICKSIQWKRVILLSPFTTLGSYDWVQEGHSWCDWLQGLPDVPEGGRSIMRFPHGAIGEGIYMPFEIPIRFLFCLHLKEGQKTMPSPGLSTHQQLHYTKSIPTSPYHRPYHRSVRRPHLY